MHICRLNNGFSLPKISGTTNFLRGFSWSINAQTLDSIRSNVNPYTDMISDIHFARKKADQFDQLIMSGDKQVITDKEYHHCS